MEENFQCKKRRKWSREETTGFLRCYLARKEEFLHPKKKRLAFSNVLEDMVSMGIADAEMTPLCLEAKMRTLLNAYKAAKDNNHRTGATPCFAPYMDLMDEIYGNSPIISNTHTVHVGSRPAKTQQPSTPQSLQPSPSTCLLSSSPLPSPNELPLPSPPILSPSPSPMQVLLASPPILSPSSSPTQVLLASPPILSPSSSPTQVLLPSPPPKSQILPPVASTPANIAPPVPSTAAIIAPTTSAKKGPPVRKKLSARERYYEKKLELKKLLAEKKINSRAESLQQFKEMLREIENKKLALMERWVNR